MVKDAPDIQIRKQETVLPDFPRGMTSFGAAAIGDRLFVFGGKSGRAHQYARSYQNRDVLMLDTNAKQAAWAKVGDNLGLQGLAVVAYEGKLIRMGGLEARNAEGEDQDLHSVDACVEFDPESGQWRELPSLPEPRSSFDACLVGNQIHVVGGWNLSGDEKEVWAETRLVLDLKDLDAGWKSFEVPFRNRALAVRHHRGKLYAIGGITDLGVTTPEVHVLDLESGKWTEGPDVPVDSEIAAFGCSAVSVAGQLLVTPYDGQIYALDQDGKGWTTVHELESARFFHQMLPLGKDRFTLVGGSHMEYGSQLDVDVYQVVDGDAVR